MKKQKFYRQEKLMSSVIKQTNYTGLELDYMGTNRIQEWYKNAIFIVHSFGDFSLTDQILKHNKNEK